MHPLPTELPERLHAHPDYPDIASAYSICVRLQKRIQNENDSEKHDKHLIYCRILGYLFHYPPTDQAITTIVDEVVSAEDDEALLKLGEMYFNYFIHPFKSKEAPTPNRASTRESRPPFDKLEDQKTAMLKEAPQDHKTAKNHALVRDGFQCVVIKAYDVHITCSNKELKEIVLANGVRPLLTHCAHIFSESTYAASVWAILDRFGYKGIFEELNGPKIHRLENVFTLDVSLHDTFDRLNMWFTATEELHKYKLEAAAEYSLFGLPKFVTFSTTDPEKLPLPNPAYLHIHATCAKIGHLSGASKYIEKAWRDLEEIRVLAEDGGSAWLLNEAILSSAMHHISV